MLKQQFPQCLIIPVIKCLRTKIKPFFGLHFVDAVEVEDIFVDLMSVVPDDGTCIKFADYLVENHVTNDSTFPPSMWADIPSDEKRTNNAAESYHAHLNEQGATNVTIHLADGRVTRK